MGKARHALQLFRCRKAHRRPAGPGRLPGGEGTLCTGLIKAWVRRRPSEAAPFLRATHYPNRSQWLTVAAQTLGPGRADPLGQQ